MLLYDNPNLNSKNLKIKEVSFSKSMTCNLCMNLWCRIRCACIHGHMSTSSNSITWIAKTPYLRAKLQWNVHHNRRSKLLNYVKVITKTLTSSFIIEVELHVYLSCANSSLLIPHSYQILRKYITFNEFHM